MDQIKSYTVFGRQVGYVITSNLIVLILATIQIPIVTKSLGTSLYGTLSLIYVTVLFIVPFSMLSFSMSLVRFLAAEKDKIKIREDFISACSLVFISGIAFSLLLLLLSGFIATYILKDASQAPYIRIGSILVLLNSLSPVLLAFFRRESNIGLFTIFNLILSILNFGLILLFISTGYGLTGVLLAAIISAVVVNTVVLSIIFKQIGLQRPHFSNMKMYLKWGIPLAPNSGIMWIIQSSDRYIIAFFLGTSAAGIYTAANSIGAFASFASLPIVTVLYPIISKTFDEGNFDECGNYFRYSFRYLIMLAIPAAVGLSILAKPLLQVLTTPEFVSGSPIVALAAFGALFNCFQQICGYVLHLVNKTQLIFRLLSVAAIVSITLNIIFIPRLGIVGAGIGYLISHGVLGLLTLLVTRRYFKFDLSIRFIVKSLFSSAIMALCIWLIKPESLSMVIISIVVGITVYFGILIIIRGFSKTELSFFRSFIRNSVRWVK